MSQKIRKISRLILSLPLIVLSKEKCHKNSEILLDLFSLLCLDLVLSGRQGKISQKIRKILALILQYQDPYTTHGSPYAQHLYKKLVFVQPNLFYLIVGKWVSSLNAYMIRE